jgi:hypothetical protein
LTLCALAGRDVRKAPIAIDGVSVQVGNARTLHARSPTMMMMMIVEACMMLVSRIAVSSAFTPANTEMRFGAHIHETEAEESSAAATDFETCSGGDRRGTIQAAHTPLPIYRACALA